MGTLTQFVNKYLPDILQNTIASKITAAIILFTITIVTLFLLRKLYRFYLSYEVSRIEDKEDFYIIYGRCYGINNKYFLPVNEQLCSVAYSLKILLDEEGYIEGTKVYGYEVYSEFSSIEDNIIYMNKKLSGNLDQKKKRRTTNDITSGELSDIIYLDDIPKSNKKSTVNRKSIPITEVKLETKKTDTDTRNLDYEEEVRKLVKTFSENKTPQDILTDEILNASKSKEDNSKLKNQSNIDRRRKK